MAVTFCDDGDQVIWYVNIQLNAPLQRKRMSVTWDDLWVVKTFLCILSVSKDTKLFHSQTDIYKPALLCLVVFNWLYIQMNEKMTRHFVMNQFINLYILVSVFVYRAGINVKNESSKQIFFYVIVRGIKIWTCLSCS